MPTGSHPMFIFLFPRSFVYNPENHRRTPGQFLPREKLLRFTPFTYTLNRLTCFGGLARSRLVSERQIEPLRQRLHKRPLVYRHKLALASIHLAMPVLTERIPVSFIFRWHQIAIYYSRRLRLFSRPEFSPRAQSLVVSRKFSDRYGGVRSVAQP